MVKPFLVFLFSLSLVFSILAPSVLNLLNFEYNEIVLIDAEEESQKKEVETNLEVDIKIIQSSLTSANLYLAEEAKKFNFYIENASIYTSTIHLPPPEYII